jgi:hypothetical protein
MTDIAILEFDDYIKAKDYENIGIMLSNGFVPPIESVLLVGYQPLDDKTRLDNFNEIKDESKKLSVFNQYLKDKYYRTAELILNDGFKLPASILNSREYRQFYNRKVILDDEEFIKFSISTPEDQQNLFNENIKNKDYDVINSILKKGYQPTEKSLKLASTIPNFQIMDLLLKNVKPPTIPFQKSDPKRDLIFSNIQYIPTVGAVNDFFCDLELFNWKYTETSLSFLNNINYDDYFKLFSKCLIKKLNLERKISLHTSSYSKFKVGQKPNCLYYEPSNNKEIINYIDGERKNNNNSFLFYKGIQVPLYIEKKSIEKLSNLGYESIMYGPIIIFEISADFFVFFDKTVYDRINYEYINNNIDYFVIYVSMQFKNIEHYSFVFFDAKKYHVEYYDPHGLLMNDKLKTTLSITLSQLFSDFKDRSGIKRNITNNIQSDYIQKNIVGIQQVENTEQDKGFCVIWGHIVLNLKLLNPSMNISDIEKYFITYCKSKNYSTYEVMLNYAEYMKRIVPIPEIVGGEKFYTMLDLLGEIKLRADEKNGWMDLSDD